MYIITNRKISRKNSSYSIFKKTPNPQGPNELRLLEMVREKSKRRFVLLDDKLTKKQVKKIKERYNLDIDTEKDAPVKKNLKLKTLFSDLFEGRRAEEKLKYKADVNAYTLK